MAGKVGKSGHHTGRTCRSPFARKARREGILVKKVRQSTENSEETTAESLVKTINYSLGKQNRWLMPEVIKSSANPREVVGEERDFLLVEQRGTQDGRRGRCISVYDSSTGRVNKPRRRYGEAQSLKSESSQADLEFEVQYPVGKWSWPVNSELKCYSEKSRGKRKGSSKNRGGKWRDNLWNGMIEEDDYFSGDEDFYDDVEDFDEGNDGDGDGIDGNGNGNDGDDDDGDDMYFEESQDHSLYTSLGEHIFAIQAKQASCIKRQTTDRANRKQNKCAFKNKVIFIDDEELVAEHQRLVTSAKVMNSLLLTSSKSKGVDRQNLKTANRKKTNTRRNRVLRQQAVLQEKEFKSEKTEDPTIESQNANTQALDCKLENYLLCEVSLQGTEILPSVLEKTWEENYREGGCIPRRFAIDLAGLLKTSSKDIDLAVMVILFELKKSEVKTSDICKASVKLVLHNGLSELHLPQETIDLIQKEFIDSLHESNSGVCSVGKVINSGIKSMEKYEILQENPSKYTVKKPFYTSDVFAEVLGYQGRSCTEREVFVQAKKELMKKNPEGLTVSSSCIPKAECGICFEDLNNEGSLNHTTLISCGHSFCNPCWDLYIKSMLNMGEMDLFCPGHQCQTPLHDITIMSLATSWYNKYFAWKIKKGVMKSPTLKHCPSEVCHLVMQVTPCEAQKSTVKTPLPVVCACNQSWCFKCQEPAHWPSQCEKAQKFRDEYKEYIRKFKKGNKGKDITSVMVKKCPTCSYPIEKFYGCDHMYCMLCGTDFCWQCLSTSRNHTYYHCNNRVIAKTEVKLPAVSKTKKQTLTDIAMSSHNARKLTKIIAVQKRLKSMEQGINAFCYLKTRALKNMHNSRISSILEGMIKWNTLLHVKAAFNFKSQAHVVLEGVAIILLKGGRGSDMTLQNDLVNLIFIMEGLDNLLKKPCSVCNEEVVSKLTELIERGKLCIKDIKRHAKN